MDGQGLHLSLTKFSRQRARLKMLRWLALACVLGGCSGPPAHSQTVTPVRPPTDSPATQPATAPSDATKEFQCTAGHFQIIYSSTWRAQTGTNSSTGDYQGKKVEDTTVLTLLPAGAKNGERVIGIDLPGLPPHIPGLIPLGMVTSGYISDQRKQHPDLKVEESGSATVPEAHARHVKLTWKEKDRGYFDMATLIVHKDQILIFSADGDADGYEDIHKAFEAIVSSIKWLK